MYKLPQRHDGEKGTFMNDIKYLYTEMRNINETNRGYICMMLNRETGEAWNDYFADSTSYKIYSDSSIVKIPVDEIIIRASIRILKDTEIAEAIEKWINKEVVAWSIENSSNA